MSEKLELDQYGLTPDDELYDFSLIQVSDDGTSVTVRPYTNALMGWWKRRMNQPDTIDIAKDGMSSTLNFKSSFSGGDSDISVFEEDDEISLDNYIEVDEETGLMSFFIYVAKPVPKELTHEVSNAILNTNPHLRFGHLEICSTGSDDREVLRFRSSIFLKKIKVGKVDSVEEFVTNSQLSCTIGLGLMATIEESIKEWVLQTE